MKGAMTCDDGRMSSIPLFGLMERTRERVNELVYDIMERRLFRVLVVDQACNVDVNR